MSKINDAKCTSDFVLFFLLMTMKSSTKMYGNISQEIRLKK